MGRARTLAGLGLLALLGTSCTAVAVRVPDEAAPVRAAPNWTRLHATHTRLDGEGLRVEIRNRGRTPAPDVVVQLELEPSGGAPPRRISMGTLEPGATAAIELALADAAVLDARAHHVRLSVHDAAGVACAPAEWLELPLPARSSAEYEALAHRIADGCVGILREVLRRPDLDPLVQRLEGGAFGFVASGSRVGFQDPFALSAASLAVNRDVAQERDPELLHRHMLMMPYWFLPHELVHVVSGRPISWEEERMANAIQPYLTERYLVRSPDAPFRPVDLAHLYDQYARDLAPHLPAEDRWRIDRYVLTGGEGAPFDEHPFDVFQERTAAYVYFIARVNQWSLAQDFTLEELLGAWAP